MATTSRRRSTHGIASSGSSSHMRRSSSSKASGVRGRLDPSLVMSTNIKSDSQHSRGTSQEDSIRRNKSTDRLPRNSESSTNLASKRSKSFIHLSASTDELAGGSSKRRKGSSKREKERTKLPDSEDGWTSESAHVSPSSSLEDEGLLLGIKKRTHLVHRSSSSSRLEPQGPETPKLSSRPMSEMVATATTTAATFLALQQQDGTSQIQPPPQFQRQDTSHTLTNEARPYNFPALAQDESEMATLDSNLANLNLDTNATNPSDSFQTGDAINQPAIRQLPSNQGTHLHQQILPTSIHSQHQLDPANSKFQHHRVDSDVSIKTLRNSVLLASSPVSVRSRSSMFSNRPLLFARETQAVAPKLDTHNALAGALGARYEDRGDILAPLPSSNRPLKSHSSLHTSTSEPAALAFPGPDDAEVVRSTARRKASVSSLNASGITLVLPSLSVGQVSNTSARRDVENGNSVGHLHRASLSNFKHEPSQVLSGNMSPERKRTTSSHSLTAADAAKLAAKLRMARDSIDDASASGFGTQRGSNPRLEKYNKPVISTFAKDGSSPEGPEPIEVSEKSVFSKQFSQAHISKGKTAQVRRMVRYVTGYGLSGPPIEESKLSDALLGPSLDMDDFESSWAPALANAAGLGSRSVRHAPRSVESEYALGPPDTATSVTGPNSAPLHLVHGLTTTSPDAFPLDPSDVPAFQEGGDLFDPNPLTQGVIQYVDPALMRAIAMTSQAIATHRYHVVTRRYADPMRESLERMARSSGKWGLLPGVPLSSSHHAPTSTTPTSPQIPLNSRWGGVGRKTAPNSPKFRSDSDRPGFYRRYTEQPPSSSSSSSHLVSSSTRLRVSQNLLGSQLSTLVDAAEHPVRSLKRVLSSGVSRA